MGAWRLSEVGGKVDCQVELTDEAPGPKPSGGRTAKAAFACRQAFPALLDLATWSLDDKGEIVLADAAENRWRCSPVSWAAPSRPRRRAAVSGGWRPLIIRDRSPCSTRGRRPLIPPACRVCGNAADNVSYQAREMLHGTREVFDYFECAACGCVQIAEIPDDLGRFYPADYFSYRDWSGLARNPIRRWIDPKRVGRFFGRPSLVGALAEALSRPLDYVHWVRDCGLGLDARVLDVGCGSGKSLIVMALGGFAAPRGVDPFIAEAIDYPLGVSIEKTSVEAFSARHPGQFDLVMFHHALEHLPDPAAALAAAKTLLSPRGRILIVVPVAGSFAWRTYRQDWCNLDPPRHLHLLTAPAMEILARRSGLAVAWRDASARSPSSSAASATGATFRPTMRASDRQIFSRRQLARWREQTRRLNTEDQGDQMMFALRRRALADEGLPDRQTGQHHPLAGARGQRLSAPPDTRFASASTAIRRSIRPSTP